MNDVIVVTVATHSEGYYSSLKEGCERANVDFVTLGWGQKWKGYAWKFSLMLAFLQKNSTRNTSSLFIFVDGYDVLPLFQSKQELLEKYVLATSFSSNDVFLVGVNTKPHTFLDYIQSWGNDLIFKRCGNFSLNSGVYAGTAQILTKILSKVFELHTYKRNEDDDQKLLTDACILDKEWFLKHTLIDTSANFVINASCALSNSMISSISTKKNFLHQAAFLHGAANCNMHAICKMLHLKIPLKNQFKKRKSSLRRFTDDYAFQIFLTHKKFCFTIVIVCIMIFIVFKAKKTFL